MKIDNITKEKDFYYEDKESFEKDLKSVQMTDEDKITLLKDLSARYPYTPYIQLTRFLVDSKENKYWRNETIRQLSGFNNSFNKDDILFSHIYTSSSMKDDWAPGELGRVKPYLRPITSLTDKEKEELKRITCPKGTGSFDFDGLIIPMTHYGDNIHYTFMWEILSWLFEHHFDIYHLIDKGLALKAEEWMYKPIN